MFDSIFYFFHLFTFYCLIFHQSSPLEKARTPLRVFNSDAKVKDCCIRIVPAYLGGFEENNNVQHFELYENFRTPSFIPFRSPEGLDSQPPALPPKQLSRKTLSQIIQAHSQQSLLDNHVNEMYDVPVNADKTTVSHFER